MTSKTGGGSFNFWENWRRLLVTYHREDGNLIVTKEGHGSDYFDALRDADEQLRPGIWIRVAISQPSSILNDVRNEGRPRTRYNGKRLGEGETVVQRAPITRKLTGVEFSDE